MSDYPAYQYSVFLKGSRDEQLVIRADNWEEFMELKKNADVIISKVETKPTQNNLSAGVCSIHNVPLIEKNGKFGVFYSHAGVVNGKTVYCQGKGYKGV